MKNNSRVTVTSRKRSSHYYLAKAALGRAADCGREILDLRLVIVHFLNWMEDYHLGSSSGSQEAKSGFSFVVSTVSWKTTREC